MIPKVINYIWMGNGKKSKLANACLNTWRQNLKDYQIIEWNDKNLDLDKLCQENRFLAECRRRKLWAFMADYLRLYVLYHHGGIYMDVDVQVLRPFDDLLDNRMFIGYEYFSQDRDDCVTEGTGVIAAEPHNPIIKDCLDYYDKTIWETDVYYIPTIFTLVCKNYTEGDYTIYPVDYFAPYDYRKSYSFSCITNNTYAIHWFEASWHENKNIGLFLQVKHIRNPVAKKLKQFVYMLKYYKRKCTYLLKMAIH